MFFSPISGALWIGKGNQSQRWRRLSSIPRPWCWFPKPKKTLAGPHPADPAKRQPNGKFACLAEPHGPEQLGIDLAINRQAVVALVRADGHPCSRPDHTVD